jgi:hypothetical protein
MKKQVTQWQALLHMAIHMDLFEDTQTRIIREALAPPDLDKLKADAKRAAQILGESPGRCAQCEGSGLAKVSK